MTFDYTDAVDLRRHEELDGFELDLVGFDCLGELEWDEPWQCPFRPGCGAPKPKDCPLMKRLAQVARAPGRMQ